MTRMLTFAPWRSTAPLVLACLLALAIPSASEAARLPGPRVFSQGLVDDSLFQNFFASTRTRSMREAKQVGSTSVRIDADWRAIAPTTVPASFRAADPAATGYDWTELDAAVRNAASDGQLVVLQAGGAPDWAEGPDAPSGAVSGSWEPNAAEFGDFARAIAQRYSGHFADPLNGSRKLPRVRYFQAWNEPNLPAHLSPQWATGPHHEVVPASPSIYRSLLNQFYASVKKVSRSNVVLSAGTAPYGDPPGRDRMKPLTFLRSLFCLSASSRPLPCPQLPHLDVVDHHPYAISPTATARVAGDVSVPDLGSIERLVRRAVQARHIVPDTTKPLWVTEFGWSSQPADPTGLPLKQQARYLDLAFYEFWRQGVSHAYWYLLKDPTPPTPGFNTPGFEGSGILTRAGARKPSAVAFAFPFAVVRSKDRLTFWGKTPRPGGVEIEQLHNHRWRNILALKSTPGGIFYSRSQSSLAGSFRARLEDGRTSLPTSSEAG